MTDHQKQDNSLESRNQELPRHVYLLADAVYSSASLDDVFTVRELFGIVWNRRWWIVGTSGLFALVAVIYSLTAPEWYRADVLLSPTQTQGVQSTTLGQLGGLGNLIGIGGVSTDDRRVSEALAVLRSGDFLASFLKEQEAVPLFISDRTGGAPGRPDAPDRAITSEMLDAVQYFRENILDVDEDPQTALVRITVEWKDRELAAEWATLLVQNLNESMRQRTLLEARRNVDFLRDELANTNVAPLRQSIASVLERELQSLMLARGNEEYVFRVIDNAKVPNRPSRPHRRLIVVLATIVGGILAVSGVIFHHLIWQREPGLK